MLNKKFLARVIREFGKITKINYGLPVEIHKKSTIPQTTIKLSLQGDSKKTINVSLSTLVF